MRQIAAIARPDARGAGRKDAGRRTGSAWPNHTASARKVASRFDERACKLDEWRRGWIAKKKARRAPQEARRVGQAQYRRT